MLLTQLFSPKILTEGGNLASHTASGTPTVGWTGIPGTHSAGKIDSKNRAAMQPAVKQLLVDINNTFTRQYGRPIWSHELLEKEVDTFISGSSKWFMMLRQPNPKFDPKQPESDANPKEIGVTDQDFQRVKKKVGDVDTQIDRRLEPQIEEFVHKNIGKSVGSATLVGTKKGSDQWLALWQINEPPITLQVDLEFVDYIADKRGFEIPTDWAQISHGSAWEDLEAGMKGVFRQWLYRSLAKVAPTDKYIAKVAGAGKNKGIKLFGGDDGKELISDINNPPPPLNDANFSFAVASVGGGGVRAKYRQPTPEENVPLEINGIPVMVPLSPAESNYIKDMSSQFEQFFGVPAQDNETQMMASLVGTVELMKQYFTPEQQQVAVQEFLKINFGKGAQMIDADDPASDFKTKMTAIDYLLDNTGMKGLRKQVLQMAKEYEDDFNAKKKPAPSLNEAEVKAQLRKGMPHLRDLKPADFLDLLDEIHDGNGNFKLQDIPLNVKVDGFGGRFGKNADGKPFMGTSRTEPRYQAGFVQYHQQKGTTDPEILDRAQLFDDLFNETMEAIEMVDSALGPEFLVNKQVTCEVLFAPFATETPEGKLKFVGMEYDKLPQGVELVLVPYRIVDASTGEDLPDSEKVIKAMTSLGSQGKVMFLSNRLAQKEGLDVTAIVPPLENIEELKQIVSSTAGKRDRASLDLRKEVEAKLKPIQIELEKAIDEDPNIIGKNMLGQDYEGIVINSRLGPIKVTSQKQKDIITAKNTAKTNARTERPRGENKTAVVAIGSFIGHKGHEELFNYTINKAKELGGDPYLFIGNAEGKDDPIPPAVKVQTWHKLYPEYVKNISTVQQGGSLIQKVKHELINPLPNKPPRYDNIVIMVGEDRAGLTMPAALMKAVNKFQGYEHVKVSLDVTPRGTGISGTMLRNSLKKESPEQSLAVWSNAFDVNKLGTDWIEHLMDITRKGMGIQMPKQQPQQPVPQAMSETRLLNALIRTQINESTSVESALKIVINDIGEPITAVYDKLKFMAKRYVHDHGELNRGWKMVEMGEGARWVQNMYNAQLKGALYALIKYNPKRTGDLQQFLAGREVNGEIEMKRSFNNISSELPEILAKVGNYIESPELSRAARRWIQNKTEYENYLSSLEDDEDDYDAPLVKPEKSKLPGQQNAQADQIVNNILKKLPNKVAGDIRNAIARTPNKLQSLQAELQKRGVSVPMAESIIETAKMSAAARLQKALQREKEKSDYSRRYAEKHFPIGKKPEPIKDVEEGKEKFNYELAEKGFHFEQEIDGVTYRVSNVKGGSDNIKIDALDQKKQVIGHASFWRHQYQDGLESLSTSVEPAWQGKGIATNMYAVMRMLGVNIHPATMQTDDGKKMWDKWRKQGDAKHIKSMNPKMAEGDSGAKYKVRSIGQDKKGEYYISPSTGEKVYKKAKVGDHEVPGSKEIKPKLEAMLPKTAFAGSDKNKLGPAAHLKGSMKRPARQGDLVGGAAEGVETEDQRLDPKCWKGYRKAGTKMKGGTRVNNCVPVSENIENKIASLIEILVKKS